jgi:dihydroneopterin aldolase
MRDIMEAKIFVKGIKVNLILGHYLEERIAPRLAIVDIEINPLGIERALTSDDLNDTFNYELALEIVNKFAASKEYKLIESFTYDIFTEIKALPKVGRVRVYVEKPAAMDGCDATAFELQG